MALSLLLHYKEIKVIPCSFLDVVMLAVFTYEVLNPFFVSRSGTAAFWGSYAVVSLLFYFLLRWGLTKKALPYMYHSLSLLALVASCIGILSFTDFYKSISAGGFTIDELIPLRFQYTPLRIMQNDWATILLCLLPFPLLSAHCLKERFRIIPVSIFFICSYAIILTLSRGIFLAMTFFVVLLVLSIWRSKSPFTWKKRKYFFVAAVFLIALIPIRKPILDVVNSHATVVQQQSTLGRFDLWNRCIEITKDHPLFGIGSHSFAYENMKLCNRLELTSTRKATNVYFQILAEKGLVGSIIYLILFGSVLFLLFRGFKKDKSKDPFVQCVTLAVLAAVALREFTFSTLLDMDVAYTLLCIWFFVLVFNTEKDNPLPSVNENSHRLLNTKGTLSICLAFLLFCGYGVSYWHYYKSKHSIHMNQNAVLYSNLHEVQSVLYFMNRLPETQSISPVVTFNHALLFVQPTDTLDFTTTLASRTLPDFSAPNHDVMISKMERAYNQAPELPWFSLNMGWMYLLNGRPDYAVDVWEQGLLYKPNDTFLLLSLGMYNEVRQNTEAAVRLYAKALACSPYTLESRFYTDLIHRDPELTRMALNESIKLLDTPSSTFKTRVQLAKLLLANNEETRAQQILDEVVSSVPNMNRAWLTLGDVYFNHGNLKMAQTCYYKSITLDREDYLVYQRLYRLYRQTGGITQQEEAMKAAQQTYTKRMSKEENIHSVLLYECFSDIQYPMNVKRYLSPSLNF